MDFHREELAWAAGFYEGEGSFVVRRLGHACCSMNNTDPSMLQRFQEIVGVGHIGATPLQPNGRRRQVLWQWQANNFPACQHVVAVLWPWLSARRREQAVRMIASGQRAGLGNRDKTQCPQGHAYDETNTRWTKAGHRLCKTCGRERQRKVA